MTKTIKMILAGLALALLSTSAYAYDRLAPYCDQGQGCAAQVAVPAPALIGGPWPKGATFHIVLDGQSIYTDDKGIVVAIGGAAGDRGFHGGGASLGGVGRALGGALNDMVNNPGAAGDPAGALLGNLHDALNAADTTRAGATIQGGDGASGGIGVGGAMGGMGGQGANAGF